MKITHKQLIELGIIFLFGLIPLLWFQHNQVILGHDSGLTVSPVSHFLDRLYAWTDRFSFGVDQSYAIPGFFIHGIEAFLSLLGLSLQAVQKVSFIFWFLLPGMTMYIFGRSLEKKFSLSYLAFPAALFYMVNHFLLQGWFVAERTKFSLYAALPLFLLFLFEWKDKKKSSFITAIYLSLLFFFLNGEASIPLFGGIILTLFVFSFFYFYSHICKEKILRFFSLAFLTALISLPLQAYWLIPYGFYISHSYAKEVAVAGGLSGILSWVKYISENSSLLNLLRLQGIPEWYQNPLHPFAKEFLNNYIFITISFILPLSAFAPLYFVKEKKMRVLILFFSILAIVSLVFMAGSHPPFGPLYVFLIKFVPGFIAFRTPFYKFAPALWFSYAVLIGITLSYLLEKYIQNEKIKKLLLYLAFPIIILIYNYPFTTGVFFDYIVGTRSMRVDLPTYVEDYGKWSALPENSKNKTLLIPPPNNSFRVDAYTWGYWSLAPLTTLLTNAPIITTGYYGTQRENRFLSILYQKMEDNDPSWVPLAKYLGISQFLLRDDFAWDLVESPTASPSAFKNALQENTKNIKNFEKWHVYGFIDNSFSSARATDMISVVAGGVDAVDELVSLSDFKPDQLYYFAEDKEEIPSYILKRSQNFYSYPECINCNLQYSFQSIDLSPPLITRSSKLHGLFSLQDFLVKNDSKNEQFYLQKALKDSLGYRDILVKGNGERYASLSLQDLRGNLSNFMKHFLVKNKNYTNDELMQLENILRIIGLVLSGERDNITSRSLREDLAITTEVLAATRDVVAKNLWETTIEHEHKFLLKIPKAGRYTLLYSSDNPNEPEGMYIDGNKIESLQDIPFSAGEHKLLVKEKPTYDFRRDESFTLKEGQCFVSPKIVLDHDSFYRLSYRYKTVGDEDSLIFSFHQTNAVSNAENVILRSKATWREFEKDFATLQSGTLSLKFCDDPKNANDAFVENIVFRKIRIPKVLLKMISEKESKTANLFVNKKNTTEYEIKEGGNNLPFIMLNTSFNKQWNMTNASSHFIANGYANGWIVEGANSHKAIYRSQKLVIVGFVISGATLVVIAIYLYKKKR